MAEKEQRCGFDLTYCEDCQRPECLRAWCQQFHRSVKEAKDIARAQPDALAFSTLVEMFATMATDLALEATKRPGATVEIIKALVTSRLQELHENGSIRPITKDDPPPPPFVSPGKTIH